MKKTGINIADYNYNLPEQKIAKYPLSERDKSKLLLYKNQTINCKQFNNLPSLLPANTRVFINNTKVIPARLIFKKSTGALIEIFCLNPSNPSEYASAFDVREKSSWNCIVGNSKKWKQGNLSLNFEINGISETITAQRKEKHKNSQIIEFRWNKHYTFGEILSKLGQIPIPPYLNRKTEAIDNYAYQTIYCKDNGSVAAPTAGLHFTQSTLNELSARNIKISKLTLHVGAGTFKPVKATSLNDHKMHTEYFYINKKNIRDLITNCENITAVGTTTMRALESIYWIGAKLYQNKPDFNYIQQWEVYDNKQVSTKEALKAILNYLNENKLDVLEAQTQIIIIPGYKFRLVNQLITNFHQPKSTLLLLVAAFVGNNWKRIYEYALANDFRFLSYGDSSLLFRTEYNYEL